MNNTNKPKKIYINPDKLDVIEPKLPPMPVISKKETGYMPPKQTISQDAEIANIENEIAMAQTPQGGNPQFQRSPEEEELKKQTLQYLLDRLPSKQVEVPQRLTIADVLNGSNWGEKLNTLAQYAQQPEFQRNIGNLFGPMTYNPQTGEITSYGEKRGREAEARLQAEQQRAIELQKKQNDLTSNIYKAMNLVDAEIMKDNREAQRFAQLGEQFNKNYELKEKELAAQLEAARIKAEEERQEREAKRAKEDRQYNFDIEKWEWQKEHPAKENLTPNNLISLQSKFMALPEIKNYSLIKGRKEDVNAIKDALEKKGRLNAVDQALIMNFNKTLDPISVVRESEFARTASGQSILDKAEGAMLKITRGGSGLSKEERNAIYKVFDELENASKKRATTKTKEYNDFAQRYGVNPRDIIMEYQDLLEETSPNILRKGTTKNGISFEVIE